MLLSNYSNAPYNTTRPKTFFADRKKLMVNEIIHGSGGRSYNSAWNAGRKPSPKPPVKSEGHSGLTTLANYSFYISIILVCLISVS
jgi:hypothetical protein